jgi:hypothetical protein
MTRVSPKCGTLILIIRLGLEIKKYRVHVHTQIRIEIDRSEWDRSCLELPGELGLHRLRQFGTYHYVHRTNVC